MKEIFRPCDQCVHDGACTYAMGCWQWKKYFRAYWRGLRQQILGAKG